MDYSFIQDNMWIFALLLVWELFWKGKALWHAAKNDQSYWFVGILIISSVGILPILYLKYFQEKRHT